MRKIAAHFVELPGGDILRQAVVEIEGSTVVRWYAFTEEQPMTEWLGGTIVVTPERLAVHDGKVITE
jgi:hypothetical protein